MHEDLKELDNALKALRDKEWSVDVRCVEAGEVFAGINIDNRPLGVYKGGGSGNEPRLVFIPPPPKPKSRHDQWAEEMPSLVDYETQAAWEVAVIKWHKRMPRGNG